MDYSTPFSTKSIADSSSEIDLTVEVGLITIKIAYLKIKVETCKACKSNEGRHY